MLRSRRGRPHNMPALNRHNFSGYNKSVGETSTGVSCTARAVRTWLHTNYLGLSVTKIVHRITQHAKTEADMAITVQTHFIVYSSGNLNNIYSIRLSVQRTDYDCI